MLWIDGNPSASAEPLDRGLEFGDGLFETIAVRNGAPRLLDAHLARLAAGCERLGLSAPPREQLAADVCAAAATPNTGVVKLILTRGAGGIGYAIDPSRPVRRYVVATPARRPAPLAGARVALLPTPLQPQGRLVGLKHLNRLEQVLLRRDAVALGVDEGLVADALGHVICGTMSNLFVVHGGRVSTPDLARAGIEGVMRGALIAHLAHAGTPVAVRPIGVDELRSADELFLTNALVGVWPITMLDDRHWEIGPVSAGLRAAVATW